MKKILFTLIGMILLVGIISAGVSLNPNESSYIKTYKIKDSEENCINVIWELEDEFGIYTISLGHCNCENSPIEKVVVTPSVWIGMDGKEISGDIVTYEIIGYEDRCDERHPQFQRLYKQYQEDRNKDKTTTTEGFVDNRLKDKVIDSEGNIK